MKIWKCWLLRHNLARRLFPYFQDCVSGKTVYVYECLCKHRFMATGLPGSKCFSDMLLSPDEADVPMPRDMVFLK